MSGLKQGPGKEQGLVWSAHYKGKLYGHKKEIIS